MEKDHRIEFRLTGRELSALKRLAKAEQRTVADIFRGRVLAAALEHDPRQQRLIFEGGPPRGT